MASEQMWERLWDTENYVLKNGIVKYNGTIRLAERLLKECSWEYAEHMVLFLEHEIEALKANA
jgi:hypothetical protein